MPDDALMPRRPVNAQRVREVGRGSVRLEVRQRFLLHRRFDVAALAVQRSSSRRERQSRDRGVGEQAANADRHVGEAAGGVQTRAGDEAEVVRARPSRVAPGRGEQCLDAGLRASAANAGEPLRDERPVHPVEADDVGDGAERDEIEQRREIRLRPLRKAAALTQQRARRQQHVEHHADAGQVLAGKRAARLVRIHDQRRGRQRCRRQVMVGDQHVDAERRRLRRRRRGWRCRCRR